jgi:DNA modification methylase
MKLTILQGDVFQRFKDIPNNSIDLCITSPPYWGLRDYSVEGQLGAEPTMEAYLENLVGWTKEVYRVLKPSGSFVLNLGDCFTGGGMKIKCSNAVDKTRYECPDYTSPIGYIYKPKQLLSVSSFAYCKIVSETDFVCRGEHIWAKPNVPSPIRSRLKHSHEKLFWFVKDADKYYFDGKAWMKKVNTCKERNRLTEPPMYDNIHLFPSSTMRTKKWNNEETIEHSWRIVPVGEKQQGFEQELKKPTAEHVAPFPTKLIGPYILSLCPQDGTVLDPFLGSGTTMRVAMEKGRNCIGIELNPDYVDYAKKRLNWGMGLGVEYEG